MRLIIRLTTIFFIFCAACTEQNQSNDVKKQLSTSLVQNPVTASGTSDTSKLPKIKFETLNFDFGVIVEGEVVSHIFAFENIGASDLIISNVEKSCGCTVPKWSKEPIQPGKKGEIEVIFDSNGKKGTQHKTVTVFANTQPNTTKLSFTADVVEPGK